MSSPRYYLREGSRNGFKIFLLPLIGVVTLAVLATAVYYFVRREGFAPPSSPYSATSIPIDLQARQLTSYLECAVDTEDPCPAEQINKGIRWFNGLTGGQLTVNGTPVVVNNKTTLAALAKQVASEPLSSYTALTEGQTVVMQGAKDTFVLQFTTEDDRVRLVNIKP